MVGHFISLGLAGGRDLPNSLGPWLKTHLKISFSRDVNASKHYKKYQSSVDSGIFDYLMI